MFSLGAPDQFALVNAWQTTREFPHIEFACQTGLHISKFRLTQLKESNEGLQIDHKGQALWRETSGTESSFLGLKEAFYGLSFPFLMHDGSIRFGSVLLSCARVC